MNELYHDIIDGIATLEDLSASVDAAQSIGWQDGYNEGMQQGWNEGYEAHE